MTEAERYAKELIEEMKDFADPNYHECSEQWELNKSILENAKSLAKIAVRRIIAEMQYPTNYSRPFRLENKIVLMNDVLMAIDKY